jgi:CheY-like chemotaxis protein
MQPKVFELFTRAHSEGAVKTSGLGIGLALAKQLVQLHGGRIELRSSGGGAGSEFIVSLPLRVATDAAEPRIAVAALPHTRGSGLRVLVVDDNRDAAESLAMLLQIEDHTPRVAIDGLGALRAFEDFRPAILLLDIGLPDMDGYEVARRIRAMPGGSDVLLIALTGWGQAEDKRRATEAGFDEHFTKPIGPQLLSLLLDAQRTRRLDPAAFG